MRIDAGRFIADPQSFTDFHAADIADYMKRFDVSLLATGVESESQIVELLDAGIGLAQGQHIAAPAPLRAELGVEPARQPQLRRIER